MTTGAIFKEKNTTSLATVRAVHFKMNVWFPWSLYHVKKASYVLL